MEHMLMLTSKYKQVFFSHGSDPATQLLRSRVELQGIMKCQKIVKIFFLSKLQSNGQS